MTGIEEAIALVKGVAPSLSAERRAACRERLPGLVVAVSACEELLIDMRQDPTFSSAEIEAVRAVLVMIKGIHDMTAEAAGEA